MTLQEDVESLSLKAWEEYKGSNISYWTMKDDDPEAVYWRDIWKMGYNKANRTGYALDCIKASLAQAAESAKTHFSHYTMSRSNEIDKSSIANDDNIVML